MVRLKLATPASGLPQIHLTFIGDEGWAAHVEHSRLLGTRSGTKFY